MIDEIPDKNLFMMCRSKISDAMTKMPKGYHVRKCRKEELRIWKAMHFDDNLSREEEAYISKFFNDVYGGKEDLFFEKCIFVCDANDFPIATCFAWTAYEKITSIHWFKVRKKYEGLGIGRALLSIVMNCIPENEYPVYLHTQPASFRAIKLYSDFGFALLTDPIIGFRLNDLTECLPILEKYLYHKDFHRLRFEKAPLFFLETVKLSEYNQF